MAHRSTRWKIVPYANVGRRNLSRYIVAGSAIRLFHVEAHGFLFQEAQHSDFLESESKTGLQSPTSHARRVTDKEQFYRPSSVYLRIPASKKDREDRRSTSINSLWFLETLSAEWGGIALTSGAQVRIRHASTNLLLDCQKKSTNSSYGVCMSSDVLNSALPTSTVFSIHGPVDKSGYISIESAVQIRHEESGTWIHGLLSDSKTRVKLACSKRHQESDSFAFVVPDYVEFPRLLHVMMAWQSFEFFERRLMRVIDIGGSSSVKYKDVIPIVGIFRTLSNAIVERCTKKITTEDASGSQLGFASNAFTLSKRHHYQELLNEQCIVTGFLHRFQVHDTFTSDSAAVVGRRNRRSLSPASRSPAVDASVLESGRNQYILLLKDELLKVVVETYMKLICSSSSLIK